jgi:hypothetical protein
MNHFHQAAFVAMSLLLALQAHDSSVHIVDSALNQGAIQVAVNPQPLPPRRPSPTVDTQPTVRV